MVRSLLIIGGNSDLAKEIISQLNGEKLNIYVVSRTKLEIENVTTFKIDDYLKDLSEIESVVLKNRIEEIIIFNGTIYEGNNISDLSNEQIKDTLYVNFVIPSSIINNLVQLNQNIRFSVISSIAASKLRKKNFYYGMSKQALEEYIINLNTGRYFIFRSGFIFTKLTENHTPPPFSENASLVASSFIRGFSKKQNSSVKYIYSSASIKVLFFIFKLIPAKVLNYIEDKIL